jgi:hypothetical protein
MLLFSQGSYPMVQARGELQSYLLVVHQGCLFLHNPASAHQKGFYNLHCTSCQTMCAGPQGLSCKVPGLMPRLPFPAFHRARNYKQLCLPELPCGSDFGSPCCAEGPACFGRDERGAALSCREGFCLSCGVIGTPPCAGTSLQRSADSL